MLSNLLPYDNYIEKPEIDFTKNIWTSVSFNGIIFNKIIIIIYYKLVIISYFEFY